MLISLPFNTSFALSRLMTQSVEKLSFESATTVSASTVVPHKSSNGLEGGGRDKNRLGQADTESKKSRNQRS